MWCCVWVCLDFFKQRLKSLDEVNMTSCVGKIVLFPQSNRPEPSNQSVLAPLLIDMGTPQRTALVLAQIWESRMDEILRYYFCATGAKPKLLSLSSLDISEFPSSCHSRAFHGHLCHHFLCYVGFTPPWPDSEPLQLSSVSTFLLQSLLRHFHSQKHNTKASVATHCLFVLF